MRARTLKDLQHTGAGDIPHLVIEFFSIQNNQVFETVCPWASQLFIVCSSLEQKQMFDRNTVWRGTTKEPRTILITTKFKSSHPDLCYNLPRNHSRA